MAYLGTPPQSGFITTAKQRVTSSTNNYVDLDHSISSIADVIVFVNFVKQDTTNLSLTTSTRITLGGTLVSSDIVEIHYLGKAVNTQTPATGTVTNDMLAGSITESKLAGSIGLDKLSATGTKSSSTFLRGDNTFAEAGGGLDNWSESSGNLLPSNASYGIYLGVNSATASNLLNDYEHGSWNPTWVLGTSGSMSAANNTGYWYKIGGFVTVYGYIAFNTQSSPTGTIYIGGLPFTPNAGYGQSSNFHGQGWVSSAWAWGNGSSNGYHPTGINVRTNGLELVSQGVSPSSDSYGGRGYTLDGQTSTMYSSYNYGQVQFGAVYKT